MLADIGTQLSCEARPRVGGAWVSQNVSQRSISPAVNASDLERGVAPNKADQKNGECPVEAADGAAGKREVIIMTFTSRTRRHIA